MDSKCCQINSKRTIASGTKVGGWKFTRCCQFDITTTNYNFPLNLLYFIANKQNAPCGNADVYGRKVWGGGGRFTVGNRTPAAYFRAIYVSIVPQNYSGGVHLSMVSCWFLFQLDIYRRSSDEEFIHHEVVWWGQQISVGKLSSSHVHHGNNQTLYLEYVLSVFSKLYNTSLVFDQHSSNLFGNSFCQ